MAGLSRYFKEKKPNTRIVAVEPNDSAVLSGDAPGPHMIQGIGAGFVPGNIQSSDYNEIIRVDNHSAFEMTRRLGKEEGILCGMSSGANVYAVTQIAMRPEFQGKTIVCILCDFGERYLSTTLFEKEEQYEYQIKR